LLGDEADDAIACECSFEVFLGIVGEAGAAGVAATGECASFDFYEDVVFDDGEVGAPFP